MIWFQDAVIAKGDRIEELEEALKESVRITAEREMVMVEQQQQLEEAERKVSQGQVIGQTAGSRNRSTAGSNSRVVQGQGKFTMKIFFLGYFCSL